MRASPRSVHQMHTIAATTTPTAPAGERQRRHVQRQRVVPTAPTHHVRSPVIIRDA